MVSLYAMSYVLDQYISKQEGIHLSGIWMIGR